MRPGKPIPGIGRLRLALLLAALATSLPARAAEHHGQITFAGLPVPGATITATQGNTRLSTSSDEQGRYSFPELAPGSWTLDVELTFFTTLHQQVTLSANPGPAPGLAWTMTLLPLDQVIAQTKVQRAPPPNPPEHPPASPVRQAEAAKPSDDPPPTSDGLLVNGSSSNAATSKFSLDAAFGNTRKGSKNLYTGGLALAFGNSALDARPFSLTGVDTPKSSYNRVTATATYGGPIRLPHLRPRGPNFFLVYQWTRDSTAATEFGLVPTDAQRAAATTADATAQALLNLYPRANVAGSSTYNYQTPLLNAEHQDSLQLRMDKSLGRRDQLNGGFSSEDSRANNSSLFAFRDTTDTLGLNANVNWQHRLARGFYLNTGYKFSRLRTLVTPFYATPAATAGSPAIAGRSTDPRDAGPPTLVFASGIASLTDGTSTFDRNRTEAGSASLRYYRGNHNFTVGGDFRRQEFNYLSQSNPRGTYTFTGAATGSDFSDFLHGIPDSSAISFGNADKYLRQPVYDLYATDDWHLRPDLSLNVGLRWEYGAPITELKNRLVNLDIAPGFTNTAQVLATSPIGPLTGQHLPASLLRPDRLNIEPRLGLSWRPVPGSSIVVRAGYGVYADTSVYQATALQLAQQAPFAKSLSVANTAACPLTLATGFSTACAATTPDTFAVDPNFRVGYAHTWQLALQRDLPAALQMTATYLGIKGTRGVQEFLPNTYALGGSSPCPGCPSGYIDRTSNGNSTREAASLQLRRRLRSGFTATALYTFSKSIDDDASLGGQGPVATGTTAQSAPAATIAQNWLDLRAERSRSSFDQRHLLTTSFQYSTGMGLRSTLLGGWRGRAYKEWTVTGSLALGSGLPETPIFYATVNGAGVTGTLRPNRTAAALYAAPAGRALNPAAYTAPSAGSFGNAGRNSITGPGQFTFNSSVARTFRVPKNLSLDLRLDANNLLNHVVFSSYDTTISPTLTSPVFGLPLSANPMRTLQTTARLRF